MTQKIFTNILAGMVLFGVFTAALLGLFLFMGWWLLWLSVILGGYVGHIIQKNAEDKAMENWLEMQGISKH